MSTLTDQSVMNVDDGWTTGDAETNGTRIHYIRTGGAKPPLVIAHGYFDDALCRTPLVRELEAEWDVIAYDARAHGRSTTPDDGYGIDDRVADLTGLLDALDVDDAVLVGHSMGGSTVASTAARHPDRVRSAVMIDPAGMLVVDEDHDETDDVGADDPTAWVRERLDVWQDHTRGELLSEDEELAGHVDDGGEELAGLLADARLRLRPEIVEIAREGYPNPRDVYPEIDVPTLILKADADETERERHREIAALLENGHLVHVDDAGHCVFRDQRATATAVLQDFLDAA